MENMGSIFGTFVFSVVSQWFELLSGCIVLAVIMLFEKFFLRREISIKAYSLVLVALVFWACFLAWKEQYQANKNIPSLESHIAELKTQVEQKTILINEIKESSATTKTELTILRHEKEEQGRLIAMLQASNHVPYLQLMQPYFSPFNASHVDLIIPYRNIGQVETTLISFDLKLFISGKPYEKYPSNIPATLPYTYPPSTQPILITASIPKEDFQDIIQGRDTINFVLNITHKGRVGGKHTFCSKGEFVKETRVC